ncbi:Lipoprotein-releasing system transmembrane protein LolE [Flavobacterium bizetiae]|uniref:Lipoprotein-releasing system transmembrane protein LolE n=1 Tax=Flavobacterium bizetiae TaxID=2704140 RepID=A0A6J4GZR9_9FLAO|nr:FtsX-like permease family protein [Flavobacterium bizetiae]CAA9203521.1 Lipoprotein-releasing system transmembrane protein LolE [Flavobacterium bizetiae]CAD5343253.1 Lipoprotein-releasing system transmembrane protein LolE [Flavobacterium bizetiae]CAD5349647.1 Lipoprotein-releasing system transmembrane protein LolE [Flavobacterium bizetiae]
MSLEYFIARRLITAKDYKSSISAPIIKIAISAIAIGIIMMIVSVATGIGLQQKIRDKVSAFNGQIIISNFDNNNSEVTLTPISKNQDFYPNFKSVPEVKHIQAIASKAGIIRTENAFEGIVFKGVGGDYDWNNIKEYIVEGKVPDFSKSLNEEVLISRLLADRLNLKLGDNFNTFFIKEEQGKMPNSRRFKIAGIFNSGFQQFDATYIIGDIRHIQRINKWSSDQVGAFEIFVKDFDNIKTTGIQVYDQTSSTLDTKTIIEKYSYIFDWLQLFDFNIVVILGVMILVATINMVVALLVLILERTQMIGILKAMGANNWTVRKIFLYNAFYLIIRGLFWGNLIGIAILLIQQQFGVVQLNPENYYVNQAPVYLNWGYIALLNLLTITVCFVVLLIPSYIITKISPVKAIRFE